MKIAITATENNVNAKLDARFGRCSYFAVYDTEEKCIHEFLANPNKNSEGGAGPASAEFIASKDIEKIISGEFGGKVKSIFETLQIEIITESSEKTIQEIIDELTF